MKTFKPFLLLIVSAISAFTLQTCEPDDEVNKTYGPYTLGEANEYLNFKPGSWWVYQNNKSGIYDTLVLKYISIRSQTFKGKNTIIKEMINMLIYSTTTKYEYKYYSCGANPDAKKEYLKHVNTICLIHGKSKPGDYQGETESFFYPFDSSYVGWYSYYKGFDSIYNLKGINYSMVRKFYIADDYTWDNWWVNYYWAKDVGLIRRENIKLKESWDLVNYHVEKP